MLLVSASVSGLLASLSAKCSNFLFWFLEIVADESESKSKEEEEEEVSH